GEEGAAVMVADVDDRGAAETIGILRDAGSMCDVVHTDVTEPESVERMVAVTIERFGRLDVLHNNAGGSSRTDAGVAQVPLDEWWRTIHLNLYGVFLGCRFAIPAMVRGGGGSIINMGSINGLIGMPNSDSYAAAKGGVIAMTRSIARNYLNDNVRANSIA